MGDRRLPLLPVPIEDMTRDSLRVFIPQLIAQAEGQDKVKMGVTPKPLWWPDDVPWTSLRQGSSEEGGKNKLKVTEVMRQVVRRCYQFYKCDSLLQGPHAVTAPDSSINVINVLDGPMAFLSQKFVNGIPLSELEATVPVSGEISATPVPTHVFQRPVVNTSHKTRTKKGQHQVKPIEIFICYFCEKDFTKKSDLHDHQSWCLMRPPELKHLPRQRKLKLVHVDELPRADRRQFVEGLGLVPLSKARVMKKHQSRSRDIEITKLDDDDTDSQTSLKSPTTPKTPRSLMSQLSRDLSPPSLKNRRKSLMAAFDEEEEECSVTQKLEGIAEVSPPVEQQDGKEKEERDLIKKTSLLTIDLCSTLGQRVKRLMNEQAKVLMTSMLEQDKQPYEEFCHTPKKTGMMARLRNRNVDFPVTFRKSRKTVPKYAHQFKFKSKQRREWYLTSLTGLNERSRQLKKLVRKCSVNLVRLSKKEIEKWGTRKKTNYYVNISRLSDLPQSSRVTINQQSPRITLHNLLTQRFPQTSANVYPVLLNQATNSTNVAPVHLTPNLVNNPPQNVVDLTPPSTPESVKSPRPIQIASTRSPEQARMLQQLLQRPLQNRLPPYKSPVKTQPDPTNNNNTTKPVATRGKKRILEEDDVICLSSDDESESSKSKPPPPKYQKTEASRKPTLLFKCHLCHTELTCFGNFSNQIEKHFGEKHKVDNIQLVEHLDSRGQKVVSIVEKTAKKTQPATQNKVASKKSQSNTVLNQQQAKQNLSATKSGQKGEAVSAKSKTAESCNGGRRRSNRTTSTSDVICID